MEKDIVTAQIQINGEEVFVDGYVYFHTETNYGADADGNRGSRKIFIDDIQEVIATTHDGSHVHLSEEDKERAVEAITISFLEG